MNHPYLVLLVLRFIQILPRRNTPPSSAVLNVKFQPLQFPFGVHVDGRSHGLPVPGTKAGGAGVCGGAPYAWFTDVSTYMGDLPGTVVKVKKNKNKMVKEGWGG